VTFSVGGVSRPIIAPEEFSAERPHLARPYRTDPDGVRGPTPWAARGTSYRRTSRGYYLPASISGDTAEQRIVEAAQVLPSLGGVTGWAALRWMGARWLTGVDAGGELRRVDLVTGYCDILSQAGFLVSQERLGPTELVVHDGLSVTEPVRSLYFAMRYAPSVRAAVVLADMTAYDDVVSLAELAAYCPANRGWTGAPQAREALSLADENAWSPKEVDTRLCWQLDADLPRPLTNRPVFDRWGHHIGTPDLLDVEAGLVVQYHGATHLDPAQRRVDLGSEAAYRAFGLETLEVVGRMTRGELVDRMLAARRRSRFEAESTRAWTADPPGWWTPTTSVAVRRSLADDQRRRMLAYRRISA
jgi:hypothetical protein